MGWTVGGGKGQGGTLAAGGAKAIVARGTAVAAAAHHARLAPALAPMGVALRTQRALGVALAGCGEGVQGRVRQAPYLRRPSSHHRHSRRAPS